MKESKYTISFENSSIPFQIPSLQNCYLHEKKDFFKLVIVRINDYFSVHFFTLCNDA